MFMLREAMPCASLKRKRAYTQESRNFKRKSAQKSEFPALESGVLKRALIGRSLEEPREGIDRFDRVFRIATAH